MWSFTVNCFYNWNDPVYLLLLTYGRMPRASRFSSNVNHVGPIGHHLQSMLYRSICVIVTPTIRKGIRRYIKNPHN
ncbi:hypothetical protein D3C76_1564040 [compost metagenome]